MNREEIFDQMKQILVDNFEIEESSITMDSNIVTDLDLDSIDAIDMVAEMQRRTNCKFNAEDFKSVKTVGDIVEIIVNKVNS